MRTRALAPAVLAAVALAAACGGDPETVTVTETETETVTETVAPEPDDGGARALAEDVCGSVPRQFVAPFLGVDEDTPEELADAFAELARPELRDAAREGCLTALQE